MSDERLIVDAIEKAQEILARYLEPGPRDEKQTIEDLLTVLDDEVLMAAQERVAGRNKKPDPAQG